MSFSIYYVQLIVIDLLQGTRGEYYYAINIKNLKMPSYHSISENACKLQKHIFDFFFFFFWGGGGGGLNIYFKLNSNSHFRFNVIAEKQCSI